MSQTSLRSQEEKRKSSRHESMSDTQSTLGTKAMERCETMVKLTLGDYNKSEDKVEFTSLTGDVLDIIAEFLPQSDS